MNKDDIVLEFSSEGIGKIISLFYCLDFIVEIS